MDAPVKRRIEGIERQFFPFAIVFFSPPSRIVRILILIVSASLWQIGLPRK